MTKVINKSESTKQAGKKIISSMIHPNGVIYSYALIHGVRGVLINYPDNVKRFISNSWYKN